VYVHEKSSSLGCDTILPNPLDHSHTSPRCSQPSCFLEHYFDASINNPMICDSNVDFGYKDMFNMLSGNVDNFLSLGYLSGNDVSLNLYCVYLVDKPKKIM